MKKTYLLLVISWFIAGSCTQTNNSQNTQPLEAVNAAEVGMSAERLERIDKMLIEAIEKNEIPGAVALVARKGKIVYHKSFGKADPTENRSFQNDDIFRIASQTKAITSTAVMMLWEQGKFKLDDPISKYIPEFRNPQILENFNNKDSSFIGKPAGREITIRQLLTHTSGIGYGMIDSDEFRKIYQKAGIIDAFTSQNITVKENILNLARMPIHHMPGEHFTYGEGLDVLGYLIEILSGQALDDYFQEHIFLPLGMVDSYFYLPEDKASRLVPVQTRKDNEWIKFSSNNYYDPDYPIKGAMAYFAGGAGLSSTAKDYALFLQMYLNGGQLNNVRLLSRTTVDLILQNHIGDLRGSTDGFGLAFSILKENGELQGGKGSAGTFSWGGYFNTQYFADPNEDIIGILMKQTQGIRSDNTGWIFQQLVFQAIDD